MIYVILDDFGTICVVPKVKKYTLFNKDLRTIISNGGVNSAQLCFHGPIWVEVSYFAIGQCRHHKQCPYEFPLWLVSSSCSQPKPSNSIDQESESTSNWVSYNSFTCLRISWGGLSTSRLPVQRATGQNAVRGSGHQETKESWLRDELLHNYSPTLQKHAKWTPTQVFTYFAKACKMMQNIHRLPKATCRFHLPSKQVKPMWWTWQRCSLKKRSSQMGPWSAVHHSNRPFSENKTGRKRFCDFAWILETWRRRFPTLHQKQRLAHCNGWSWRRSWYGAQNWQHVGCLVEKDMSCARLAPHFWSSGDGIRSSPVEGVVPFKQLLPTWEQIKWSHVKSHEVTIQSPSVKKTASPSDTPRV